MPQRMTQCLRVSSIKSTGKRSIGRRRRKTRHLERRRGRRGSRKLLRIKRRAARRAARMAVRMGIKMAVRREIDARKIIVHQDLICQNEL